MLSLLFLLPSSGRWEHWADKRLDCGQDTMVPAAAKTVRQGVDVLFQETSMRRIDSARAIPLRDRQVHTLGSGFKASATAFVN